jgi:hypothetical protein
VANIQYVVILEDIMDACANPASRYVRSPFAKMMKFVSCGGSTMVVKERSHKYTARNG